RLSPLRFFTPRCGPTEATAVNPSSVDTDTDRKTRRDAPGIRDFSCGQYSSAPTLPVGFRDTLRRAKTTRATGCHSRALFRRGSSVWMPLPLVPLFQGKPSQAPRETLYTDEGNEASYPLEMCSHFDADEIKRLGKRFKKLDLDNSGSLSVEEFMSLPELQQNPLVQRVIDIFDTDGNGEVDFKEFIEGVSQFSVKGDKEQKLRFAFRIYDMDKDGYISNGELFQVLKMMVGNNLKDTQLQQIVDKTIINADKDGDGRISFEEFCAVVGGLDIHKKMVVDV
ncbi:hypothetical protein P4O66_021562, partial [Electrophorus voltai]